MKKILPVLLLLLMIGIFLFSSQEAAQTNAISYRFCEAVVRVFYSGYEDYTPEMQEILCFGLNSFVRKMAHFALFALMGFCGYLWLSRIPYNAALVLGGCAMYAALDELHQCFVPGRTGQLSDILLDSCGAACGMGAAFLLLCVIYCVRRRSIVEEGVWKSE